MHRIDITIQNFILIQNFCFRKLVLENMGNNLRKSKCFWHLLFLSKWCWFSSIDCSHTLDFTWDISFGNFMQVWSKYNGTLRWKFKYNCLFRCISRWLKSTNQISLFWFLLQFEGRWDNLANLASSFFSNCNNNNNRNNEIWYFAFGF